MGLRYQQLESTVRSIAKKVTLLEATNASCLVERCSPLSVSNESGIPREEVEKFHGLVVPQEPKPPESDGAIFTLSFILSLALKGIVFRMLYVRMCGLRLRSLRGFSLDVQNVARFASDAAGIHGDPTI